jgi:hypothetical protein
MERGAAVAAFEQALDLGHGQRDLAGIFGREAAGAERGRGPECHSGDVPGLRRWRRRQRRGDEHGVSGDRGVEAYLGLIVPKVVLSELKSFFDRPSQPGCGDQALKGDGLASGNVGALTRGQMTADQQPVPRVGGG